MLCTPDISKGHAACKIPAINLVDKENFVEDVKFIYTEVNVDEHGFVQREFGGCTCVDECVPGNCECIDKSSIKITDDCRIDLLNGNPGCYETILIECDKKTCNCHGKCGWKVTPDRFKLEVELFKTPQAGWAVRSRQCIEAGTYISEFVGEYCNAKRMENRPLDYAYNILQLNKSSNVYIDPYVYGNITRFFNHSCFENLQPFRFLSHHRDSKRISLGFYASRDIMPGDEMTIDYGIEWWTRQIQEAQRKDEHFYCYCDWVYCLNPAPGKPQMEKEDALEEIKQRIAENSKTIMLLKKIEERRKLGLTKNEEKGGKSKQKRKSKIGDNDDGDESSITDDEDSDEEEKEESNNGKENLE